MFIIGLFVHLWFCSQPFSRACILLFRRSIGKPNSRSLSPRRNRVKVSNATCGIFFWDFYFMSKVAASRFSLLVNLTWLNHAVSSIHYHHAVSSIEFLLQTLCPAMNVRGHEGKWTLVVKEESVFVEQDDTVSRVCDVKACCEEIVIHVLDCSALASKTCRETIPYGRDIFFILAQDLFVRVRQY